MKTIFFKRNFIRSIAAMAVTLGLSGMWLLLICCSVIPGTGPETVRGGEIYASASGAGEQAAASYKGAQVVYENADTGYVAVIDDGYCILTEAQKKAVAEVMVRVTGFGNAILLTTPEVNDAESYPRRYYLSNYGAYKSGVVFYIDPEMLYIYSEGDIYDTLGSSWADTIADNVYTLCNPGTYMECCIAAFNQIGDVLEGKRVPQPMKYACNIILGLLIAFFVTYIIVDRKSRLEEVSDDKLIKAGEYEFELSGVGIDLVSSSKAYAPRSSGGHGGRGGHGGGGHHGGGGGHRH